MNISIDGNTRQSSVNHTVAHMVPHGPTWKHPFSDGKIESLDISIRPEIEGQMHNSLKRPSSSPLYVTDGPLWKRKTSVRHHKLDGSITFCGWIVDRRMGGH